MAEVVHRSTNLKRTIDDAAVGLAPLLAVLHIHEVVALRIHQRKACRISTYPRLTLQVEVGAIDHGNEVVLLAADVLHMVLEKVRITMFPQ